MLCLVTMVSARSTLFDAPSAHALTLLALHHDQLPAYTGHGLIAYSESSLSLYLRNSQISHVMTIARPVAQHRCERPNNSLATFTLSPGSKRKRLARSIRQEGRCEQRVNALMLLPHRRCTHHMDVG